MNRQGRIASSLIYILFIFLCSTCDSADPTGPSPVPDPDPGDEVFKIPVVVHVIHEGEEVGMGFNVSDELIFRQIEIVNEDFRRKEGTRGFNNHPD